MKERPAFEPPETKFCAPFMQEHQVVREIELILRTAEAGFLPSWRVKILDRVAALVARRRKHAVELEARRRVREDLAGEISR